MRRTTLIAILLMLCLYFALRASEAEQRVKRMEREQQRMKADAELGRQQRERDAEWKRLMRDEYYEQEPAARVLWLDDMKQAGVDNPIEYFGIKE